MKNQYNLECNIAQTLNIIGDKWTLLIIHAIMIGKVTYKELQEGLEGIPTNLLSNRLKELEEDGIITCKLYQEHPPRYEYLLTDKGEDLQDVFNSIILWGEKHLHKCYKRLIDKSTGESVELRYYCKQCNKQVNRDDLIVEKILRKEGD